MQRTDEYQTTGGQPDRAGALAWLRQQDRWDRRLRALEGAPPGPVLPSEPAHPRPSRRIAAR